MRSNTKSPVNKKFEKKDIRMPLLILLGAVLLLLIIAMPKTPVVMAVTTSGTGVSNVSSTTHSGLRFSEVMMDNTSALPDEHGNFGDWVELVNTTQSAMELKNVGLSDRSDRIKFIFPDYTLQPGERVIVFCDDTNADDSAGTFHAKFKLSSYGETLFFLTRPAWPSSN